MNLLYEIYFPLSLPTFLYTHRFITNASHLLLHIFPPKGAIFPAKSASAGNNKGINFVLLPSALRDNFRN